MQRYVSLPNPPMISREITEYRPQKMLAFPVSASKTGAEPKKKRARTTEEEDRSFRCIATTAKRFGSRGWYIWAFETTHDPWRLCLLVMWNDALPPSLDMEIVLTSEAIEDIYQEAYHTVVLGSKHCRVHISPISEDQTVPVIPRKERETMFRLPFLEYSTNPNLLRGIYGGCFPRSVIPFWWPSMEEQDPVRLLTIATARASPFLSCPSYTVPLYKWKQCFDCDVSLKETQQWAVTRHVHGRCKKKHTKKTSGKYRKCTPCWDEMDDSLDISWFKMHVICHAYRIDRAATRHAARNLVRTFRKRDIRVYPQVPTAWKPDDLQYVIVLCNCHVWTWEECIAMKRLSQQPTDDRPVILMEVLRYPVPSVPWPFGRLLAYYQDVWSIMRATPTLELPLLPEKETKANLVECFAEIRSVLHGRDTGIPLDTDSFQCARVLFPSLSPRICTTLREHWEMYPFMRHIKILFDWPMVRSCPRLQWLFVVTMDRNVPSANTWYLFQQKAQCVKWIHII